MKLILISLFILSSHTSFALERRQISLPPDIQNWMKEQLQYEEAQVAIKQTSCRLPANEIIKIGCTYHCGFWERWALFRYAKRMGYRLQIISLFEDKRMTLNDVDAVLIPGGADINPDYYSDHVEPDLQSRLRELDYLVDYTYEGHERDPFEYQLLQDYFQDEKQRHTPILGICRGMQMLAVSQRVPLYIDLKAELGIRNRRWKIDRVYTKQSTLAQQLYGWRVRGVKYHHQGIRLDYFNKYKKRWPHLEVSADSFNGRIAETLEFKDRPILGTQFHPEWTLGWVRSQSFRWLLNKACEKKRTMI